MADILLNKHTGDIEFTNDGDISFTDSIMQEIMIRLKWFSREWKMNRAYGVDYFGTVFVKKPSRDLIESQIMQTVLSVDGVEEFIDFDIKINSEDRSADIFFRVRIGGETKDGRVEINV